MKQKSKRRKQLLLEDSPLELYARKFYINRYSHVTNGWYWESKIRWGLPSKED